MQASASDFSKILHLDCGRKYFTKDWIIALLYEMQVSLLEATLFSEKATR